MTPEQRAKAVVEHFAEMLPPAVRPQLESVIARAITRAVNQELTRLQRQRKPTRLNARTFPAVEPNHGKALVGKTVRLRDSALHGAGNAYPLPDGLTDGQTVTLLAFDHGYFTVKDTAGKEWRVFMTNIGSSSHHNVRQTQGSPAPRPTPRIELIPPIPQRGPT